MEPPPNSHKDRKYKISVDLRGLLPILAIGGKEIIQLSPVVSKGKQLWIWLSVLFFKDFLSFFI